MTSRSSACIKSDIKALTSCSGRFQFSLLNAYNVKKLHKNNIRLKIIGDVSRFSEKLQEKIAKAENLTENNTALTLNIAANYGGCWDIVQATQQLAEKSKR